MQKLSQNGVQVEASGFLPKLAPAAIAGVAAWGGAKFFTTLSGPVVVPGIGAVDATMAYGAVVAGSALVADGVSKFVLPKIPLPVSANTANMFVVPAVAGAAGAIGMNYLSPNGVAREGQVKLGVIGAGSYLVGKQGAQMLGLGF